MHRGFGGLLKYAVTLQWSLLKGRRTGSEWENALLLLPVINRPIREREVGVMRVGLFTCWERLWERRMVLSVWMIVEGNRRQNLRGHKYQNQYRKHCREDHLSHQTTR